MDNLVDPFVEYTADLDNWSDENTMKASAVNYTYTVPQNWYPIFAGVIYEADMVGLTPGKTPYRYRVGGYDPVNATIRRSQDFSFASAPTANPDQNTKFAMFGDQVRSVVSRPVTTTLDGAYSVHFMTGHFHALGVLYHEQADRAAGRDRH